MARSIKTNLVWFTITFIAEIRRDWCRKVGEMRKGLDGATFKIVVSMLSEHLIWFEEAFSIPVPVVWEAFVSGVRSLTTLA